VVSSVCEAEPIAPATATATLAVIAVSRVKTDGRLPVEPRQYASQGANLALRDVAHGHGASINGGIRAALLHFRAG
jgi:hypothetical protein